jgi:sugar phosphate isomerase/epimerase
MSVPALTALALPSRVFSMGANHNIGTIGLQLYTVREAMRRDFAATLVRVAAIGYREVEFADYFGNTPAQVRATLDSAGLVAPSAHVPVAAIGDRWEETLAGARTIGNRYLVVASAGGATDIDGFQRIAERFNRAGQLAAKAGIRFGYHNHDFEFTPLAGTLPYDVLLEATDPKHVCFEMDLYWITKAGLDPLTYFTRWPHRFPLVHVKDSAGPPAHRMADVGAGTIDWRRIFARATQAGVEHCFVERDDPEDAFASIAASYAYLRDLRF